MGLMDIIVAELNKAEEKKGSEGRWERLHSKPVELVETPRGIHRRDTETGRFLSDEHPA